MAEDLYALSARAADGLAELLRQRDGGGLVMPRGNQRREWFVQCTEATAVGGNDVLDQCYPARIIRPAADLPLPVDADMAVLLTVIGADGEAVAPTAGAVYLCELTGETPGDRSGSLAGRPRAFGAAATVAGIPLESDQSAVVDFYALQQVFTDSWTTILSSLIALPSAGTYLVWARVCGSLLVGTAPSQGAHTLEARMLNGLISTEAVVCSEAVAGETGVGSVLLQSVFTVTSATNIPIQARYVLGRYWGGLTGDGTVDIAYLGVAVTGVGDPRLSAGWVKLDGTTGAAGADGADGATGPAGTPGTNAPDDANAVIGSRVFGF